jgi:two-component system chemotaxis response regulator CheB
LVAHKDRVIGVVLSGQLDDGSTGLWWAKRYVGVTVMHDPMEAAYPDLPHHAQSCVDVDFLAGASDIGPFAHETNQWNLPDRLNSLCPLRFIVKTLVV